MPKMMLIIKPSLLHASENAVILLFTAPALAHSEIIIVNRRLGAVFHFDILARTSHFSPGKTFGLAAGEAVNEARRRQRICLVEVLCWQRGDRRGIRGQSHGSRSVVATKTATKQLNCGCQVSVVFARRVPSRRRWSELVARLAKVSEAGACRNTTRAEGASQVRGLVASRVSAAAEALERQAVNVESLPGRWWGRIGGALALNRIRVSGRGRRQ